MAAQHVRRKRAGLASALAIVDPPLEHLELLANHAVELLAAVAHARDEVDRQQLTRGLAAKTLLHHRLVTGGFTGRDDRILGAVHDDHRSPQPPRQIKTTQLAHDGR